MQIKPDISKEHKKYLILITLIILLTASAFFPPIYINHTKNNWEFILVDKLETKQSEIQEVFNEKSNYLIYQSKYVKSILKDYLNKELLSTEFIKPVGEEIIINLFDDKKLVFWNYEKIPDQFDKDSFNHHLEQTGFLQDRLTTYLTYHDTLFAGDKLFFLITAVPIEKKYQLKTDRFERISITNYLSEQSKTSLEILFNPEINFNKDGRYFSFPIINNLKNKIGTVILEIPSLDNEIIEIDSTFRVIQSFIFIALFFYFTSHLLPIVKKEKKKRYKFIYITLFIVAFRIIIFILEIPSSLIENTLTDSGNFSSTFAYGIVRSPLELFISSICALSVIYIGFRHLLEYYDNGISKNNKTILFIGALIICSFFFLLILRGLGASLRSVVFDSSIRYFKEFNLMPDAVTFIMQFNILIIGTGTILMCLVLIIIIFLLNPLENKNKKVLLLLLFVFMQLFGWAFDYLQKLPQGTPLIRVLFITIVFGLLYLLLIVNYRSIVKYVYVAFGASIAAVMLLTYYNSEIERESLKTTAMELTRTDENIYRFMVHQTLVKIKEDEEIKYKMMNNSELSSNAFIVWSSSLLHTETIPVSITFYDLIGNLLGNYTNSNKNYETGLSSLENINDDVQIELLQNIFGKQKIIKGTSAILNNNRIIGFVEIKVILDESNFGFENIPVFLTPARAGISSAVEIYDLNIFYIENSILQKKYGNFRLSENEINKIANVELTDNQEAWLNIKVEDEEYLVYILALGNTAKRLALAKERNNLSWNLSNFFKVFFVHTLMILTITFFTSIWNYKKTLLFIRSYRTKLATVFVIVAIIPLFIIAIYFRNITEKKNVELITTRLTETTERLVNYLINYSKQSLAKSELIFTKAVEDIGADFTIYGKDGIEFSTTSYLYRPGLLPAYIPFKNYIELCINGYNSSIAVNQINGKKYYSSYKLLEVNNQIYIVEVNNLFNTINLPLSSEELDIFMFGLYSLAVILLIVLSTTLANQISFPIRKLTHATRSLGSGDLNIEVHGKFSGEIEELKNGFNMMVKKLRKSQLEMARFERETAWKEMAKQVAHEIKNPLTPMKLSVQQLVASYKDKSPKFDTIFEKVTSTIINQIETLRNIASEFSNFARMPKLNIERIEVVNSIKEAVNLFIDEKLSINIKSENENIFIDADQDHFNRTIINLVRNSIQAYAKNILIKVETYTDYCLIRVIDDGAGIKSEIIDKVFEENFTTKNQGMGLGLSMAKKFIEHIGGSIIIEKTTENGTVVLMKIPIAK